MKPTFLIIGAQKSGTTSCIDIFNQHPNIYLYNKWNNEIHYFDLKYKKINYELYFNTKKKIIGEKTPSYCYLRYAIDRIHNDYPNIKLIFIIREPIQRAYSQYNMDLNKNKIYKKKSFIDSIKEIENIKLIDISDNGYYALQRGFYIDQLEYIYSKFPKGNVYISISEEIEKNPEIEYNNIFNFLNQEKIGITFKKLHIGKYKSEIDLESKLYLYNIYKPYNKRLYKLLGREISAWEEYYKSFFK